MKNPIPFSVVFLAGGTGNRMQIEMPKQFLQVGGKPLCLYSFEVFASMAEMEQIVVVCEPQYESYFLDSPLARSIQMTFARPGTRRQDSVFNGISCLSGNPLVSIHDSARPLINPSMVRRVVNEADEWGAAVVGVKSKSTIKVSNQESFIVNTPNRDCLWEVQTPQVIRLKLLKEGFAFAQEHFSIVTDDVSLVELLGKPVKLVEGSYANLKVTTAEDLFFLEKYLETSAHDFEIQSYAVF